MRLSLHKKTTTNQLLSRCRKGDRRAYKTIYDQYAKAMLNISMRILNNKEEAEEVIQDSFIKAFENLDRFDGKFSFGSWLKRIVINRSLDIAKKRKIDFQELDGLEVEEELEEHIDPVYDIQIIRECIQELPDGYRMVLSLYLIEKYSHKEIAALLNIQEGTSKSQYNRARKKLQQLISHKTITHEQ